MEFINLSNKKLAGIYCILNTVTGKFYIGSTVHFWNRYKDHRNALIREDHHSSYMQRSCKKHGMNAFQFHIINVIDSTDKKIIRSIEQKYLDVLQPYNNKIGFNSSRLALGTDVPINKEIYRKLLGRKVVAYNLDGTFFKEFRAISEAAEELNISAASIHKNCKLQVARGRDWIWQYVDDTNPYPDAIEPYKFALLGAIRDISIGPKIVAARRKNGTYGHKTEEARKKCGNGNRGKSPSIESNIKRSISQTGKKQTPQHTINSAKSHQKPIAACNWLGDILMIHDSLKDCAKHYGIARCTMCAHINSQKEYKGSFLVYLPKNIISKQEIKAAA